MIRFLMDWLDAGAARAMIMMPEFISSYIADSFDGSSQRRYAIVMPTKTSIILPPPKVVEKKHDSENEQGSSDEDGSTDESDYDDDEEDEDDGPEFGENVHLHSLISPPPLPSLLSCEAGILLLFQDIEFKQTISVMECDTLNCVVNWYDL